jgi:hypothetical protein
MLSLYLVLPGHECCWRENLLPKSHRGSSAANNSWHRKADVTSERFSQYGKAGSPSVRGKCLRVVNASCHYYYRDNYWKPLAFVLKPLKTYKSTRFEVKSVLNIQNYGWIQCPVKPVVDRSTVKADDLALCVCTSARFILRTLLRILGWYNVVYSDPHIIARQWHSLVENTLCIRSRGGVCQIISGNANMLNILLFFSYL